MTQVNGQQIRLSSADVLYSQEPGVAYHVTQGTVRIYIVPLEKGRYGKRVFLCEAGEGRLIPTFVYRDRNYKNWRFAMIPRDSQAVLTRKENVLTEILKKNFLRRAGLNTYDQEGFENSLVEHYKREDVKDRAYLKKGRQAAPEAQEQVYSQVKAVFDKRAQTYSGTNANYGALQFLCSRMGIRLIREEDLVARCGKNPELTDIARASHFICRKVVLEKNWYTNDCGGLVGKLGDEVVACYMDKKGKYQLLRTGDGTVMPLTGELAEQISPEAWSIGRTLPVKKLTRRDVLHFCAGSIMVRDILHVAFFALVCALIGILLPTLNEQIYDKYIPLGEMGGLTQLCLVMLTFMIGNVAFSVVKNLFDFRTTSRIGNDLQNAAYHRLFHLPESFFRKYDSADLGGRVAQIGGTANSIANALLITGIGALFSLVYLIRMFRYSAKLTWWSLGMYGVYVILIVWIASRARKGEKKIAEADAEADSKLYQYLNGVDKIRMAGSEEQAMLSFMRPYARQQSQEIRVNRLVSARQAITCVISSVFSMVLYLIIVRKKIDLSVGAFVAFNAAFGAFTGAIGSLVDELLNLYQTRDIIHRFWPVFAAVPEDDESKEVLGTMSGGIALEHVSFAYDKGSKNVINDLSLTVAPGEYVGIVGASGCGKSTLLKLLLGFEKPRQGTVLVDGKDLDTIDKSTYRRQLGVVLQNGRLISGSIYENITITAPDAPMSRVNQVIEQVGLKEDISQMPMGIHTVLSENCNTISGGQQQRILIARAIVGNPKMLIFDEATSALDNLTQAAVSSNLDKMHVTRIVVAHRLSTIKNCSRILVLKDGQIAEEGDYRSLMARKGLFYELASRQIAQ